MKNRATPTVITLVLSMVFVLGLSSSGNLRAADLRIADREDNNLNLRINLEPNNINLKNLRVACLNSNNGSLNQLRLANSPAATPGLDNRFPNKLDLNRFRLERRRSAELI